MMRKADRDRDRDERGGGRFGDRDRFDRGDRPRRDRDDRPRRDDETAAAEE